MTSQQIQQAVDRFSEAAQGHTPDLHDATGDLLAAIMTTGQGVIARSAKILLDRLDTIEERLDDLQREIETIARERAVGR